MSRALHEWQAQWQAEWIARARAGDRDTWRSLYDRHVPLVYRLARRMGVPEAEFGDLCQDVFVRVFRGLGRFRGEAQFSTWLYRIVLHEVARAGRSRGVRALLLSLVGRPEPPPLAEEQLIKAEASAALGQLLSRMKPKQREVFVLYELEELPVERIAEILRCPPETVRSRLRHARADFSRLHRQRQVVEREANEP